MISFTEEWWGETFDERLVQHIAGAPFKHLETFREDWPFHRTFRRGLETLHPELEMFDLPPLAPGELRPALRNRDGGLPALVLLLYSQSVVLSSGLVAPFSLPGRLWEERSKKQNRRIVEHGFTNLLRLKPLVERNLAYFTNLDSNPPFESYLRGGDDNWLLEKALQHQFPEITDEDLTAIVRSDPSHSRLLGLATRRQLSLVAHDEYEYGLFFNATDFAWKMLSGVEVNRPTPKPAHFSASTLARTVVPELRTSTETIAMLHDDEKLFNEWRTSLHEAISMVGDFEPEPSKLEEARGILAKELDASTTRLREGLEKSALSARLKGGLKGFAIGASSALLTTFGTSLSDRALNVGLGGALGAAIDVAATSKNSTKRARLIDGVVFDFRALAVDQSLGSVSGS